MSDKVIPLRPDDNRCQTIEQMLDSVRESLGRLPGEQEFTPTKALVIFLDKGAKGDGYTTRFSATNLSASEIVALCEVMKERMLRQILG